jgi:hypothetical protein
MRIAVSAMGCFAGETSGAAHCPQNLNVAGFSNEHLGQISASGLVHCPQNFIASGFPKPHFEQRMVPILVRRACNPRQKDAKAYHTKGAPHSCLNLGSQQRL